MAAKRGRAAVSALELAMFNDIVSDVLLDAVIGLASPRFMRFIG